MSTIKIEHVDPNSGRSIAFDIMRRRGAVDPKKPAMKSAPDGTSVAPVTTAGDATHDAQGRRVDPNYPNDEVSETFVLRHGQFKVLSLSGELMLREVGETELAERERVVRERSEIEAEVTRERAAKTEAERVKKLEAERAERKAVIEKEAGAEMPADQAAKVNAMPKSPQPVQPR